MTSSRPQMCMYLLKHSETKTKTHRSKKHLGRYLTAALVEVVEKHPEDPIEYIAKCLNVYADMEKQQKDFKKVKAEISEHPPSCLCEHLEEGVANSSTVPPDGPPQDHKIMKETCPEGAPEEGKTNV
uniref:Uncharacterized protein n=1 Tax=Denticeps clupeoides TaxID=299321 RepID=A0AAY4AJK0_9TELE